MATAKGKAGATPGKPGRPIGLSRSLDAACLHRELMRRGLTWEQSIAAVRTLLGSSKSTIEKYRHHVIEPALESTDRLMAVAVLWRYPAMIRAGLNGLEPDALAVLREMTNRWQELIGGD